MEYKDLLESHLRYGTTKEDIRIKRGYEKVLKNVVIAPWWKHEIFDVLNYKMEELSDHVYNFYGEETSFTFIEIRSIGAPALVEYLMPLGVTNVENIIFIGSVGSLDESIKIGDLVIPEYSLVGDGSSRYFNDNFEDEFMKKKYPSENITNKLIDVLKKENYKYHIVPNFSTDTIFGQFIHLDQMMEEGARVIEMETACLFKCNEILKRNITALFCVSDNTVINKSVYSGRTDEEEELRHKVRYNIMPNIIVKTFIEMEKE